jgi:hypothetical protein
MNSRGTNENGKIAPSDTYEGAQRANVIAAVIVAILVVCSVSLLISLDRGIKREDCFAAGHRTCAPIDERQH